jgi:hypothetical protein
VGGGGGGGGRIVPFRFSHARRMSSREFVALRRSPSLPSSPFLEIRNDPRPPRDDSGIKYLNGDGVEVSICVGWNECISNANVDTAFPTTSAAVPSPAAVDGDTIPSGTSTSMSTATDGSSSSGEGGLAGWAISLIVIMVVAALCCIGFGVVCVLEKRNRGRSICDGDDDGDRGSSRYSVRDGGQAYFDPINELRDDRSRASSSRGGHHAPRRHSGASHLSGPARDDSSVATRAKDRPDDPSVASNSSKRNPPGLKCADPPFRITQEPAAYAEGGDEDYEDAFMGSGLEPIVDERIGEPPSRKEPTMYVDGFTVPDDTYGGAHGPRGGGGSQMSRGNQSLAESRGGKSIHSIYGESGDALFQASYNSRGSVSVFSQESNPSRKSNSKNPGRQRSIYSY